METLTVTKKLNLTEYTNSEYPNRIAENFGYEHLLKAEHSRWEKYNPDVFIVEADPKINYGLDFKVYLKYNADGINFFKQISYGTKSLSNHGFRQVMGVTLSMSLEEVEKLKSFDPETINNKIWFGDDVYDNTEQNRKIFRKLKFNTFA